MGSVQKLTAEVQKLTVEYRETRSFEKFKVALAQFPGGGVSRMETNAWVVKTVRKMDRDKRISEVVSLTYADTPITMLRNRSVLEARQHGCHYLLMLDSDMAPDVPYGGSRPFWDVAWEFMMERRRQEYGWRCDNERFIAVTDYGGPQPDYTTSTQKFPPATIAAPYCGPPPAEWCYVFHWASMESDCPGPNHRLEMIPREAATIRSGIQEVAALPTGLILYDMRVFDILPPPWFCYEYGDAEQSIKVTTEDVYQTRNASLLGLPQFVAWDSWAAHVKVKHVGKPSIVTRDEVHKSLVHAILRGVDRQDRMIELPKQAKEVPNEETGRI